jgi:hypothetical protein
MAVVSGASPVVHELPSGLVVVERFDWYRLFPDGKNEWMPPDWSPALGLSHEEIRSRYRGVEGDPWPDGDGLSAISLDSFGLAAFEQFDRVFDYYLRLNDPVAFDLLAIGSSNVRPSSLNALIFVGFDYAYGLDTEFHYSLIHDEVVYGRTEEMRSFAERLNEWLLLPSVHDVESLHETRARLVAAGSRSIEELVDEDRPSAVSVYAIDRSSPAVRH